MTSSTIKKPCAKCNKGVGTAMCYGCEQAFCTKHFIEHRQKLSQQIDIIGQEHDDLRRDLTNEQGTHPLLARINQWEQASITKIQTIAESARSDLQQVLSRAKNNLKTSISKMTEELQSSRESDDFTELDIKKWSDQLEEFRKILDSPPSVKIDDEKDTGSVIRLIKVIDQRSPDLFYQSLTLCNHANWVSDNLKKAISERFADTFGRITLSEGGCTASNFDNDSGSSGASGTSQYSSGIHFIRFRIEQLNVNHYTFFGIFNSSEKINYGAWNVESCNGWWDLDYYIVNGRTNTDKIYRVIRTGDEVTLMLDCDNRQIKLQHHRTNRTVDMPIDLRLCAFPWKIMILLGGNGDCVRILH